MSVIEKLVKSRKRVRQHGEVFTPVKIVNDMLNLNGMKEKVEDLRSTVLEPAAGEGVFLVEILKRRLNYLLTFKQDQDITQYENQALLALTTLYGIELLEDNIKRCVMNLFVCFYNYYRKALEIYKKKPKEKVLNSARTIISANVVQGNFLLKTNASGEPIVFSEWKEIGDSKKNLIIVRTEYTLDEIKNRKVKNDGEIIKQNFIGKGFDFISFFGLDQEQKLNSKDNNQKPKLFRYVKCNISEVYKEEVEEYER